MFEKQRGGGTPHIPIEVIWSDVQTRTIGVGTPHNIESPISRPHFGFRQCIVVGGAALQAVRRWTSAPFAAVLVFLKRVRISPEIEVYQILLVQTSKTYTRLGHYLFIYLFYWATRGSGDEMPTCHVTYHLSVHILTNRNYTTATHPTVSALSRHFDKQ